MTPEQLLKALLDIANEHRYQVAIVVNPRDDEGVLWGTNTIRHNARVMFELASENLRALDNSN